MQKEREMEEKEEETTIQIIGEADADDVIEKEYCID